MKRNYIGLGTSPHDPSIAILNDAGEVVFAEDSERYLQNKRAWCSPPDDFVRIGKLLKQYCDADAQFVIATSWRRKFLKRLEFATFGPMRGLIKRKIGHQNLNLLSCVAAYANPRHGVNTEAQIHRSFGPGTVERREFDHHLTHSATACLSSTYTEAVSVVIDGMGEAGSLAVYHFREGEHVQVSRRRSVGSLGQFYSFVCELCGFDPLAGEEWKVMGLAPYGRRDERWHGLLSQLLVVDGLKLREGTHSRAVTAELQNLRRKPNVAALDFADLAHTGQLVFSELLDKLLMNVHALGLSDNLVLSGGCALNSAYVGGIADRLPFSSSYVFCAPADNGNSVGAALLAHRQDHPQWQRRTSVRTPYLGSSLSDDVFGKLVAFGGLDSIEAASDARLYTEVADEIARGAIVAWVQGRAEFGPRALGNRSILADPRNPDVKEIINARVKFREEFRPFAPSILAEHGPGWFEHYCDTPYMERALRFKPEVAARVPGVVHVDGTGRLQSVHRELNPDYYGLIEAFYRRTGVPILLNTSFNVMGKPIVHSVEDAIAVFFTSGIDLLVIGRRVFRKPAASAERMSTRPPAFA
jgi:carbamoyltransferase